jgi:proline iminopeptidase
VVGRETFTVESVNGGLAGWCMGSGPPVLLLHGGPGLGFAYLDALAAELEPDFRVASFQQRGLEPSTLDGPFTMAQAIEDVVCVLDGLQWKRAFVVGHSWGGHLALRVAAAHPERLLGMVAIEPIGVVGDGGTAAFEAEVMARTPGEARTRARELDDRATAGEGTPEESVEAITLVWPAYFADPENAPPMPDTAVSIEAYAGLIGEITSDLDPVAAQLATGDVPFGVVAGAGSPIPWGQAARASVELSPGAFLDVVPNAGHFVWLEAPGRVRAALRRLSDTVASPANTGAGESHANQEPAAGEPAVRVSALEHPMVLAAFSRMASAGAWQRIVDAQPLTDDIDLVDARFLAAAGAITRITDDTFQVAIDDPMYSNPRALANWTQYLLRRALQHASGENMVWGGEDPETIVSFGRASGRGADIFADQLLPQLPRVAATFAAGRASFLDVGVGIGAISIRLIERLPGTRAVGLDVLPEVLKLAEAEVARSGLSGSVELRLQSVTELRDRDQYDLAWFPQPFIPRPAFLEGIHNVFRALKPGGAMILPVAIPAEASEFARARAVHSACLAGGSAITAGELVEILRASGFVDLAEHPFSTQRLMTATKPSAATG